MSRSVNLAPRRAAIVPGAGRRRSPDAPAWPRRVRRLVAIVLPFAAWWLAAVAADNRLLPDPWSVFERLVALAADGTIWLHGQVTAQRGLVGLLIAVAVGVLLGIGMATTRWLDAVLEPLVSATYPVPKLALYPLLVLALGFGGEAKIAMVALECLYPVTLTTYAAVRSIDKHYLWLARNVGAGALARFEIIMRAISPAFVAALRMATPIMLVIMVVTELLGESQGLGYLIRRSSAEFDPETTMAVVLLLAIVGFALDRVIVFVGDVVGKWAGKVRL